MTESASLKSGVKRLLGLIAIEDTHVGLKQERDAEERQKRYDEQQIYGDSATDSAWSDQNTGDEDMSSLFVAGDVTLPPEPSRPSEPQVIQVPIPAPTGNKLRDALTAAAVGAGLLGGGAMLAKALIPDKEVSKGAQEIKKTEEVGTQVPAPKVEHKHDIGPDNIGWVEPDK